MWKPIRAPAQPNATVRAFLNQVSPQEPLANSADGHPAGLVKGRYPHAPYRVLQFSRSLQVTFEHMVTLIHVSFLQAGQQLASHHQIENTMQLKLFQTRIAPEHMEHDTALLNHFLEKVLVRQTTAQFVPGETDFWSILVFYEPPDSNQVNDQIAAITEADLTEADREVLSALKTWRRDQAAARHLPEYIICPNSTLIDVARHRPRNEKELSDIRGFGPAKITRYGADIVAVVNAF